MMRARRLLPFLLALVLGAGAAIGLAACGSSDALIPSSDAAKLERQLASLQRSVDGGECDAADAAVAELTNAVANLPKSVDTKLRDSLHRGVANLAVRAPQACLNVDSVTITTPAVTTPVVPDTTPTEPTPPPTTPTEPTPPPTTPTEPTPPEPTTPAPDPSGGAIAP